MFTQSTRVDSLIGAWTAETKTKEAHYIIVIEYTKRCGWIKQIYIVHTPIKYYGFTVYFLIIYFVSQKNFKRFNHNLNLIVKNESNIDDVPKISQKKKT